MLSLLLIGSLWYTGARSPAATTVSILGGVADAASVLESNAVPEVVASAPVIPGMQSDQSVGNDSFVESIFPGSVVDSGIVAGQEFSRSDVITYKVKKGDTLTDIASFFGVSLDTLIGANPSVKAGHMRVGEELYILPTSGIVYKVQDGDTIESIAAYFGIPESNIKQFNKSVDFTSLGMGSSLVIPGGKKIAYGGSNLPNFNGQFIKPADGFNWGKLHPYNAIDISNSCGTPVVASAEGLVVSDDTLGDGHGGWNGGYGNFVLIEHPFGDAIKTRYTHLKDISVSVGDYVKQGDVIGTVGDTGEITGCRVSFEVYGAQNPFVK